MPRHAVEAVNAMSGTRTDSRQCQRAAEAEGTKRTRREWGECTTIWAVPSAVAITVISNVISKLYNIMQTCGGNRRQEKKKHFYEIVFVELLLFVSARCLLSFVILLVV